MIKNLFTSIIIISCLVPHFNSVAQRYDNNWVLGYDSQNNPIDTVAGNMYINFSHDEIDIFAPTIDSVSFDMSRYCISSSNYHGDLIFYSNGIDVLNANNSILKNSEDHNYHPFHEAYKDFGLFYTQAGLALPAPANNDTYYLFHTKTNFDISSQGVDIYFTDLYYSVIDMLGDGGLGSMVKKGIPVINDTLSPFALSAIRHTNGRDWWITATDFDNIHKYYVILVNENGPTLYGSCDFSSQIDHGVGIGQAHFSPDGNWYVRSTRNSFNEPVFLDVFTFDRCNGDLQLSTSLSYGFGGESAGMSISKNSRFVYTTNSDSLFQFDLFAQDFENSKTIIDIYDGYRTSNGFYTAFNTSWLAPDGKIYMNCINGIKPMHVIHRPNEKGQNCNFVQRGLYLPKSNAFSTPNHPNYRLGPIDGSPCDTLGIDNNPLSRWRHDDFYLQVKFTNLSDYEPSTWFWTFGDGGFSSDTSPVHTYEAEGFYEVCLIVSNINDSDTLCRTIQVRDSLTATSAIEKQIDFILYPNPASDFIYLKSSDNLGYLSVRLFDLQGRLVLSDRQEIMYNHFSEIDMQSISSGIYLIEFWKEGLKLGSEKVMVMH